MYDQKLSIIIPTKNRQQYAFRCISALLNFHSDKFEIVVQDNSDDSSLREMLKNQIDGVKLKYSYTKDCLSFCANFEKGVELSNGDYLITIGDDDCVFPEIVELTDALREKGVEAAVFATQTAYMWPNAVSKNSGKLIVRKQKKHIKILSTAFAWDTMVRNGFYDYQKYSFPKIYHGIIKREKFDLVKEKTGHYFGGLTPDIYSAVALSLYIDRILYISTPFTLPGTCAKSGSADSLTGRHTGELSNAPHFRGHEHYEWDEEIPRVYSVDTIWAETAFKAYKENGKSVHLTDDECFALLAHIVRRCPAFQARMADFYANKTGCDLKKAERLLAKSARRLSNRYFIQKCWRFVMQVLRGRHAYNGVADIEDALKIARKNIKEHKKIIEKVRKIEW